MSAAQELPCELEPRRGPAEAILSRRSSRAELPEWLLKAGADVQDESGSEKVVKEGKSKVQHESAVH